MECRVMAREHGGHQGDNARRIAVAQGGHAARIPRGHLHSASQCGAPSFLRSLSLPRAQQRDVESSVYYCMCSAPLADVLQC